MGVLDALELEERVGALWHRLVGERASMPSYPEAAIELDSLRPLLAVFFRGLGGDPGVAITSASARQSGHRLSWRQRLGMDGERLEKTTRDETALSLPGRIALFPDPSLNRDLYFWLAAFMAEFGPARPTQSDPLTADLAFIAHAAATTARVLELWPGLIIRYRRLADAHLAARPNRDLNGIEQRIEIHIRRILTGQPGLPPSGAAPVGYKPFLPVPLWGEAVHADPTQADEDEDDQDEDAQGGSKEQESKRRHAERQDKDHANRKDPLILNRFEKILAMADMVNVNRGKDDTDEEEAKKAADDLDTLTLAKNSRKVATKLAFDLDLPPSAATAARLTGPLLYPEWDYRGRVMHPDHCRVILATASQEGEDWAPDDDLKRRIRAVRRQFEALRTRALILRGQVDGSDLDTDAAVRARCDLRASGIGTDRVWMQRRPMERDLAVSVLVDASLSTDAWVENRRVLDVEKEALLVFSHGLSACGDSFQIATFTSRKHDYIKIDTVKSFDEPFDATIERRIGAIKPGYYTRIGAALRHATAELDKRPCRHRLLLVLTDGKPNDIDHYEGRYGIEDTRKAIQEARKKGLVVFGVTIDRKAQSYFPHMFGRSSFAIVRHPAHLSAALPRIYRHLAV